MLHIGTSGWQYRDWRGRFYPADRPARAWLAYYAATFSTVEVNSAFYRLPAAETFRGWAEQTPPDFVIAVKASRYLTHIRRLIDPVEPVARFLNRAAGLGGKLGPVLLQLPPTLTVEVGRLDETLAQFPAGIRVAVEPRHRSWWTDEVRAVLTAHGAALGWADRDGRPITPRWVTADFGYLRMHAGRATPRPSYGRARDRRLVGPAGRELLPPAGCVRVLQQRPRGGRRGQRGHHGGAGGPAGPAGRHSGRPPARSGSRLPGRAVRSVRRPGRGARSSADRPDRWPGRGAGR